MVKSQLPPMRDLAEKLREGYTFDDLCTIYDISGHTLVDVAGIRPPVGIVMTARLFELVRHVDVTGKSGTGVVAYGAQWADGTVSLRWAGEWPSFSNWADLETLLAVHGHEGATEAHFVTGPDRVCRACGCSDNDACPTGCYWVARDLCSACVQRLNEQQDRDEDRIVELGHEDEYAAAIGAESPLESFDREDR